LNKHLSEANLRHVAGFL